MDERIVNKQPKQKGYTVKENGQEGLLCDVIENVAKNKLK